MPLTRDAIEVVLDLIAQFARPTPGIEPGRSPCRYAHWVLGTTRTGGSMSFDRYGRQVLNSQFLHGGPQPLKSVMRAYSVGGTSWVQSVKVSVLRVPAGFCPPLQVKVVHCV